MAHSRRSPATVVDHAVILGPVGADLVAALAAPRLRAPAGVEHGMGGGDILLGQALLERRQGVAVIGVALAPRCRLDEAGRQMGEAQAAGLLVAMLTALAGAGIPVEPQLMLGDGGKAWTGAWLKNSDRDGRGMDPAAPFAGRDALEAVSAGFVLEEGEILALDFEDDASAAALGRCGGRLAGDLAGQSAQAGGVFGIGGRELGRKEPGILAALGGANLDQALHDVLLSKLLSSDSTASGR